jgi:monovalent cation:H+ antiporter-2, CPA2 family
VEVIGEPLVQVLLLLGLAVAMVLAFQRLRLPSVLAYLAVGVMLGPYTAGPVIDDGTQIRTLAEFGIVFLLFTIGLSFSLPQIHALRHLVLGLGTAQVFVTALVVAVTAWLLGLPAATAFVVGAVFAQSSTTIISKQLTEQGEEHSRHGRLGTAMSVFQDVTAVPFVVIIPVLGVATAQTMAGSLAWALAKALLAFGLVFVAGRWLLRPLFHAVAGRRSAELFTLTVLFVTLTAAGITSALGLSMAFGAFLAGMMLGETEFRHQVESTIRPFRDVLLGLFFVGIGMLIDPFVIPAIWHLALAGAAALLIVKALLVAPLVRIAGLDPLASWRTALLLAVGGEFGFALLAVALTAGVIAQGPAQVVLTAVLFSMIAGPFLIRYNRALAVLFTSRGRGPAENDALRVDVEAVGDLRDHVIICGYGRIGQSVGHFLEEEGIAYVALDLDPSRVRDAHVAGEPVFYADAAEPDILEAVGVQRASLIVISHDDVTAALKVLHHARTAREDLPVMVRTRDESHVEELRRAGATEVVPETLEAGMMIASAALLAMQVPLARVMRRVQKQREARYRLLREYFRGDTVLSEDPEAQHGDRLRPIVLQRDSAGVGRTLAEIDLDKVVVTALARRGKRTLSPALETRLMSGDVVVLFGSPEDLQRAENALLG